MPVWKVCITQPRYRVRNFDALIYLLVNFENLRRAVFKLSSQGWVGEGGGGQNFEHVCLRCLFKICESFKYRVYKKR